jgi:type II secretory pathway pseudopilin PulG
MIFRLRRVHAFSLVEVTLAIGIAAFCLLAVFGLMPIGVQTNRNTNSQAAAANIMAAVIADMRAASKLYDNSKTYYAGDEVFFGSNCYVAIATTTGNGPPNPTYWTVGSPCPRFGINFGTPATLYFDTQGQFATSIGPTSRYQLDVTFPTSWNSADPNLYAAYLKVTWPPNVLQTSPAPVPSGSAEMFAVFDRN